MNNLVSIRTNLLYSKKAKKEKSDPDEFIKHFELIFLVDKPGYRRTNDGEIIRERCVDELRFTVSQASFKELIVLLTKLEDADESDLE